MLPSVEGKSESETGVVAVMAELPFDRRLFRRFECWGVIFFSSAPLAASASASLVTLVPSLFNIFCLAAMRSPPETVLFRPSLEIKGGGVGDGDGS